MQNCVYFHKPSIYVGPNNLVKDVLHFVFLIFIDKKVLKNRNYSNVYLLISYTLVTNAK